MTTTIQNLVPELPVLDMARAEAYYCGILGCTLQAAYPDFMILAIEGCEFHLWLCDNPAIPESGSMYIRVSDIDACYERYRHSGKVVLPLQLRPWGIREFYLMDDSGNLLKFGPIVSL